LKVMAHTLDWSLLRDAELTALAQPHLDANTTASAHVDVPIDPEGPITLQIGERRFKALPSTLCDGSTYFAAFFSGRWEQKQSVDGSVFIDGDGDSFEHLLRYLRLKEKPFFWNRVTGFDRAKYNALRVTADYFGVMELSVWIKAEGYKLVVTIKSDTQVFEPYSMEMKKFLSHDDDTKTSCFVFGGFVEEYRYPRGKHNDDLNMCIKKCNVPAEERVYDDVEVSKTLVVREKTIIDWTRLQ